MEFQESFQIDDLQIAFVTNQNEARILANQRQAHTINLKTVLDKEELDFYFSPNLSTYFYHQARQMIKDLETMNHNERLELPEVEQDPIAFYYSKIGESVRIYDEL